jgi:predicted CXXCH cytochrome family protein
MKQTLIRLLIGLACAVPLALLTFAFAQAETAPRTPHPQDADCQKCHAQYQQAWAGGAHSRALTDQVFVTAWEAQGKPKECLECHTTGYDPKTGSYEVGGVSCTACHNPVASNHPLAPAFMSRSAEMCGQCHRDTLEQWKNSKHGSSDLTCVSCHDPHATSLRAKDTGSLCADCHGTLVAAYGHSAHAQRGMTCTDCHITLTNNPPGMGLSTHDHSFKVDLNTCTKCHASDMHNAAAAMLISGTGVTGGTPLPSPQPTAIAHQGTVAADPKPVSPWGFALFAALIGLAGGIVLAPWLERGFRRAAHIGPRPEGRP